MGSRPNISPGAPAAALAACLVLWAPIACAAEALPDLADGGGWWRDYRDPALDGWVARALAANRDLRNAAANLRRAAALVDAAKAASGPQVSLSGAWLTGSGGGAPGVVGAPRAASLGASLPLDLFARGRRAVAAAKADAAGASAAADASRVDVAAATVSAYLDACALRYDLAVAQRNAAVAEEVRDRMTRLEAAGARSALDVRRAAAAESEAQAVTPLLTAQRQADLSALAVLVGASPAEAVADLTCSQRPRRASPVPAPAQVLRAALATPAVRQAEAALAADTARADVAAADLYPTITVGGSSSAIPAPGAGPRLVSAWGPVIAWSLPARDARARLRAARASADATLAAFDEATLTALKRADDALSEASARARVVDILAQALDDREAAYAIARAESADGALGGLDLLQTEAELLSARRAFGDADRELARDEVALYRATATR